MQNPTRALSASQLLHKDDLIDRTRFTAIPVGLWVLLNHRACLRGIGIGLVQLLFCPLASLRKLTSKILVCRVTDHRGNDLEPCLWKGAENEVKMIAPRNRRPHRRLSWPFRRCCHPCLLPSSPCPHYIPAIRLIPSRTVVKAMKNHTPNPQFLQTPPLSPI